MKNTHLLYFIYVSALEFYKNTLNFSKIIF
jgi:hypothetical protein